MPHATATRSSPGSQGLFRRLLRENGLSLTMLTIFALCMVGQISSGHQVFNDELSSQGAAEVSLAAYLASGHFLEATAENWESEFLQMAGYVLFTSFLFQRGSAESKSLHDKEAVDRDPRLAARKKNVPWPVRRGGWVLKIYEYSLTIALLLLFAISFFLHAVGGVREYNLEQVQQGAAALTLSQFFGTSAFWFQSFQNWQSEFFSLVVMSLLSIFLRQRGSPESKPVDAPHDQTGSE